ncbi:hypothetical protein [Glaciecola sp. MF2-115]
MSTKLGEDHSARTLLSTRSSQNKLQQVNASSYHGEAPTIAMN